jgi:hypothetical protein
MCDSQIEYIGAMHTGSIGSVSTSWRAAWVLALAPVAGCKTAMTITIASRGPTLAVVGSCGDQQFRATLAPRTEVTWRPTANNCHIGLGEGDDPRTASARDLTITTTCQHDVSCGFGVQGEPSPPSLTPGQRVVVEVRGLAATRTP